MKPNTLLIRQELIGRLQSARCSEKNLKRASEQLLMLQKHLTEVGWPNEVPLELLSEAFLPPDKVFPQMIPVGKLMGFRICQHIPATVAEHGLWVVEFYTRNTAASGAVFSYITCSHFDSAEELLRTLMNGPVKETEAAHTLVVKMPVEAVASANGSDKNTSLPKFASIGDFQNDDSAMKDFIRLAINAPVTSERGLILEASIGIEGATVALESKIMSGLFMKNIRDWVNYDPGNIPRVGCIYNRLMYLGLIVKMEVSHFQKMGLSMPKETWWILVNPDEAVRRIKAPPVEAGSKTKVIGGRKVEVRFEAPPSPRGVSVSPVLRPSASRSEVAASNGHSALLSLDVSEELAALVDLQQQLKVADSELAAAQAQVKALEERRSYLRSTITGPRFSRLKEVYATLQDVFQT